ncbi:MAG: protein phosphatase 2C domain-containing protein [Anaerolineales bacterium]
MTHRFDWLGSRAPYLDTPWVMHCGTVIIGCYGGNSQAGARHNEDAALIWQAADRQWTFAAVLDAHTTGQSAMLVLNLLDAEHDNLVEALSSPTPTAFEQLHKRLLAAFTSQSFRQQCQQIEGETACLIAAQKDNVLFWFSVGDCVAYLFHPELARLGQHALNQRQFFEWIGRTNTFDLPAPCYSTGVRELRGDANVIALVTDGVLESPGSLYDEGAALSAALTAKNGDGQLALGANVERVLARIHQAQGRDSATIIVWRVMNRHTGAYTSA